MGLWWACDCWNWKWQTTSYGGWWTEDRIHCDQKWQCQGKVKKITWPVEFSEHSGWWFICFLFDSFFSLWTWIFFCILHGTGVSWIYTALCNNLLLQMFSIGLFLTIVVWTVYNRSETEHPAVTSGPSSITAVVAFSKGFACACGQSLVHLFEKSDEKDYRKTREIQVCAAILPFLPSY